MRSVTALILSLILLAGHVERVSAQSVETLRNKVNEGTVSIISGGVTGTYIRIASDLASVLDQPGQLRILPIVGKGSVQNIIDLLYLRGIDIAIVQSDTLSYSQKLNLSPNIARRIRYITKLYNEEVHILAGRDIHQLSELNHRKVNVDIMGSGTAMTASTLFGTLGLEIDATHDDQALALEKLKNGEIAAMVYVVGKPGDLFRRIEPGSDLHFVPIPFSSELLKTYLPSSLSHADYPDLIPEGESPDTVAVGAVMAVYNWDPNSERYRRAGDFVEAFFNNFSAFLKAPRHPKWQEVNLAAEVPGWTRFQPAQDWLDRQSNTVGAGYDVALKNSFDAFLAFMQQGSEGTSNGGTPQSSEALFAQFLEWRKRQGQQTGLRSGQQRDISILTGDETGVYYPLGQALAAIYRRAFPGSTITVQTTHGSVQNLNLLQSGRGEVAFALADSVGFAWQGVTNIGFAEKLDKLRTIAAIYPNYIQIVASRASGIDSLEDLKGKRVSVGAPRSGTEVNARRVFQAAGLTYDMMDVEYLPFSESVALMKEGQLDATLQSAGLGVASIRDLAHALPIAIVPVPPAVVQRIGDPTYLSRPIPAGTYLGEDRVRMTAAMNNLLMTREGLPDEVVYTMTKSLFENLPELVAAHPAARDIALATAAQGLPVPLHPGAARYYREQGVLK